jgi:hypothetical protein
MLSCMRLALPSVALLGCTLLSAIACAPVGSTANPPDPDPTPSADFDTCIPDAGDGPIFKETLTLASADGSTLVRIVRRPGDGPTIGETFAFELLGFAMQEGDSVLCVVDAASLAYDYQHHNWDDTATVTAGSGDDARTLTLTLVYDVVNGTWTDTLDDGATDGNLALSTYDCVSEGPSPANGCFQR